jgi:hypothetical protein
MYLYALYPVYIHLLKLLYCFLNPLVAGATADTGQLFLVPWCDDAAAEAEVSSNQSDFSDAAPHTVADGAAD